MEYTFKTYKQSEFDSAIKNFCDENKISFGMISYNRDGDITTAIVADSVIDKLTEEQKAQLLTIR